MITVKYKRITASTTIVTGKCAFCGIFLKAGAGGTGVCEVKDGTADGDLSLYKVEAAINAKDHLALPWPVEFKTGLRVYCNANVEWATVAYIE